MPAILRLRHVATLPIVLTAVLVATLFTFASPAEAMTRAQRVGIALDIVRAQKGDPYRYGAAGPNAFDCSGLVMWAFGQAGVNLPHSSQALASGGQAVSMDQMQPGDLITYYGDASHVAIYIGDGLMVHASTYGSPVAVAPVNNAPIHNVRRY